MQAGHLGHRIIVARLGSLKELTLAWEGDNTDPDQVPWIEQTVQAWAQLTSLTSLTLHWSTSEGQSSLLPVGLTRIGGLRLPLEKLQVLAYALPPHYDDGDSHYNDNLLATLREILVRRQPLDIKLMLLLDSDQTPYMIHLADELCQKNPGIRLRKGVAYKPICRASLELCSHSI